MSDKPENTAITPAQPAQLAPNTVLVPAQEQVKIEMTPFYGPEGAEWKLIYGPTNGGKTHDALDIGNFCTTIDPKTRIFYIDTDKAVSRNLSCFPKLKPRGLINSQVGGLVTSTDPTNNFFPYSCRDFFHIEAATKHILEFHKPTQRDWIVVDRISMCWPWFNTYYVKKYLNLDLEVLELQFLTAGKKGSPLFEYSRQIKMAWQRWEDKVLYSDANILFIATEKPVHEGERGDKPHILATYADIGFRPDGQGDTESRFHTVIRKSRPSDGVYHATTIRDRGSRVKLRDPKFGTEYVKVTSLAFQYLMNVAKWEMPKKVELP